MDLIRFFSTFANDFNIIYQKLITVVRKVYLGVLACLLLCIGCEWHLKPNDDHQSEEIVVERYDRIQTLYLTTGDRSALQQLNTRYPGQTRMLIEDMLKIGHVNDPMINSKFLHYFKDSVLQAIMIDVEKQYADISDIDKDLSQAFKELHKLLPDMHQPVFYAQIGALNQSIVVGDSMLGISLDKYLGADYPLYERYYPAEQRQQMTRKMIVPDCVGFYILSLYPLNEASDTSMLARREHMGKIQYVVNRVTKKRVFTNDNVKSVEAYMRKNPKTSIPQLLEGELSYK